MTEISFGSTFRVAVTQAGVNSAKKDRLKNLILGYDNGLVGKSKTGYARVSMPDSEDNLFIARLKGIGYRVYQKFEGENIPKSKLDRFIKEKLDTRNFAQKGKNMEKMSKDMREQKLRERRAIERDRNNEAAKFARQEALVEETQTQTVVSTPDKKSKHNRGNFDAKSSRGEVRTNENTTKPSGSKKSFVSSEEEQRRAEIRKSAEYNKYLKLYGPEATEFMYFGIR